MFAQLDAIFLSSWYSYIPWVIKVRTQSSSAHFEPNSLLLRMKYLFILLFASAFNAASSQILTPVKWQHTISKGADNTYKITFKAAIQPTWHVYSQIQPKNAIAQPLLLSFNKNPQVVLQGKSREVGKLVEGFDKTTKIRDYHNSKTLEVVQLVRLKNTSKATLPGVLTYQKCKSVQCRAPEDYEFSVSLN